jgi:hypothetical protein
LSVKERAEEVLSLSEGVAEASAASASAANQSKIEAEQSAALAFEKELESSDNADEAVAAKEAAVIAQGLSEQAKTGSEAARDKAEEWAEKDEDVEVEEGRYSAKHFALKAEEFKIAAEQAESNLEAAVEAAELAKTGAEAAANSVIQSAEQIILNTAEIASIENTINSMNPNQETRTTVTGVDTISLPKTAANTGMQVQLFGQSAQNLVVNGDFRNGTTGWEVQSGTLSASNGVLTGVSNGGGNLALTRTLTPIPPANNIYYIKFSHKVSANTLSRQIRAYWSQTFNLSGVVTPTTEWSNYSFRGIQSNTTGRLDILFGVTGSPAIGETLSISNVALINLTATFGAGNEPTKDQCDLLFANYFEGTDNVLGTGRVRSIGKNLFDKTNVVLNATIDASGVQQASTTSNSTRLIRVQPSTAYIFSGKATASNVSFYDRNGVFISSSSIANASVTSPATAYFVRFGVVYAQMDTCQMERGTVATTVSPFIQSALYLQSADIRSNGLIKDEIRKGTNGYELIKRVGVGTLGSELVTNAADREFSSNTGYWSLATANISNGTLNITSDFGNAQRGLLTIGKWYRVKLDIVNLGVGFNQIGLPTVPNNTIIFTQAENNKIVYLKALSSTFRLSGAPGTIYDNISIKELIVADGDATGSTFTEIGSNIHYTLATPTITPIAHAGLLNSNSNGTTYFEPVIADAGVYSTKIDILLTEYPISSLERIIKRVNGVDVELSTSTAVIAGNGLSFTHPNLANGDLVMFTYAYNRESIGRSMTLTHYDNRFTQTDTANGKVYTWKPVITNGVVTGWTTTEV